MADERIPLLLDTPAAVRFLSCEPLLGPLDLRRHLYSHRISWVICGGESGPRARPMALSWARSLQAQCDHAGTAFFMKQLGGAKAGNTLDELPEDLRAREYPAPRVLP